MVVVLNHKKKFTNFILLALEKSIDGYVRLEDFLYNPGFYAYSGGWDYPLKRSYISKALKRLREKGFVELISDEQLAFRITDSGRDKILWEKMKQETEWDGKWRLVIWDIPEKRRSARDLLRSKLKQLGFVQWQKSIWASKKNCTDILRKFIKDIGIEDWVKVIESDNVGM